TSMNRYFILILTFCTSAIVFSQEEIIREIQEYQDAMNEKFSNQETSILKPEDFEVFKGLQFYPIDLKYRVEATLHRTPDEKPFLMPTTTNRRPEYVKYGELHFTIDGKQLVLDVFQAMERSKEYEDYL